MEITKLKEMKGGWFIGDFEPSCHRTRDFEIACKSYESGMSEPCHEHRVATEITLIASGKARMNGVHLGSGDIVILQPGESADFVTLEKTTTVVVKFPSVIGDKYIVTGEKTKENE